MRGRRIGRMVGTYRKEDEMSYRDQDYTTSGTTHPVGMHTASGGSAWGLAIVLVVLLGLLGLAMMVGPADQRNATGTGAPMIEPQTPVAPAQPVE